MPEVKNGYEYLEMLRQKNGKQAQNFKDFSTYLESKARERGIPIHGQFELTPLCNLNCGMCYVHLSKEQMQGKPLLTTEQWKGLIHQAFEAGMFQATLTGGECLAYPGFEELYLYLHSLGCEVNVLTNGTLLDESRIRFFEEHPPASIQITLYGENEDVYERVTGRRVFHTVLEHINQVKEAGLALILTVTPNRALGEDVFETIRLATSITDNVIVSTFLFVPPSEPWRKESIQDLDMHCYARILKLHKELKGTTFPGCPEEDLPAPGGPYETCEETGLYCGGGRSGFVVNWRGEMLICNRLEPRAYPLRDGFAAAWRQINEVAESWPRVAACRGCAYEEVCNTCAATVSEFSEAGKRPQGLCERTRYLVSQGVLPVSQCK